MTSIHETVDSGNRVSGHSQRAFPAGENVTDSSATLAAGAISENNKLLLAMQPCLPAGSDYKAHVSLFNWLATMVVRLPNVGESYFREPYGSSIIYPAFPSEAMGVDETENRLIFACYEAGLARAVQRQHCSLLNNVSKIGKHFGLDAIEECLLVLFAAARLDLKLMDMLTSIGEKSAWAWNYLLADMFGCTPDDIDKSLNSDSKMAKAGLVYVSSERLWFEDHFRLFPDLETCLANPNFRLHDIAASFLMPAGKPLVRLSRFGRHKHDIVAMARLLEAHIDDGIPGCNILLHGEPGAGKTQLAIQLARYCHASAATIKPFCANGQVRDGLERLEALRQVQGMASALFNTVVIFDNMENILPSVSYGSSGFGEHKYWFTSQMEQGRVPVIWVVNDISGLDASLLQRFTYVLKVKPESDKASQRIIRQCAEKFTVDEAWVSSMTAGYRAIPAVIRNAGKVARLCASGENEFRDTFERCLGNFLEARGEAPVRQNYRSELDYQPEYCNTSIDLNYLATALARSREGRICVYGPPGTGKTALARYVGKQLGITVLHRKASDLLGRYIGETEQAIAGMFAEAKRKKALLLLDEADTFLGNRSQHGKSWETSMVNELLVQLESFNGIFIATTNLFDGLDPAVMRRFDFKLHFDYLDETQRLALFATQAGCTAEWLKEQGLATHIKHLQRLTPGDFATVSRRLRILGEETTPQVLLDLLAQELAIKNGKHTPIGFIH